MKNTLRSAVLAMIISGAVGMLSAAVPTPSGTRLERFPTRIAAYIAGLSYAAANGGALTVTSGTPSMEPLIHGQTYAVVQKRAYASIEKRDLLVYMGRPNASKPDRLKMLHRAVMHDRHGWLMSGDNNRWSESWDRVTPQTYLGTVIALFEFPQT